MRRAVILGVLAAALVQAAAAQAGCWATVALAPPPAGIGPDETWTARLTVLQHGRTPLPDAAEATPRLTIVNEATGARRSFPARGTADPTVFVARVVFPAAGSWRYEVFDGFTSWQGEPAPCARTHTFAAVSVGGGSGSASVPPAKGAPVAAPSSAAALDAGGSGFPLWPVVGGIAGALAASAGAATLGLRRRHAHEPS